MRLLLVLLPVGLSLASPAVALTDPGRPGLWKISRLTITEKLAHLPPGGWANSGYQSTPHYASLEEMTICRKPGASWLLVLPQTGKAAGDCHLQYRARGPRTVSYRYRCREGGRAQIDFVSSYSSRTRFREVETLRSQVEDRGDVALKFITTGEWIGADCARAK